MKSCILCLSLFDSETKNMCDSCLKLKLNDSKLRQPLVKKSNTCLSFIKKIIK